ncbi:VOC family protein [Nocardia sp. NPDC052566]|uniref:VOC family protein n=1 Tax=Nocardia sp. NPDC052566 TaxID=3364330 RepID=UPI0037CB618A
MNVVGTAVILMVADPAASSEFFGAHLGFREILANEDFICLGRDDACTEIELRRSNPELPQPSPWPTGVTTSLAVIGIAGEYERLLREGAHITAPLHRMSSGEWALRLTDPNGVVVQLIEWIPPAGA